MRFTVEQIGTAQEKRLFPVYLVCGDEPLQHAETLDSIRAICRKSGYINREILDVESGFGWDRFDLGARTMGLFSDKRLLELRFGSGLPDKKAENSVLNYLEQIPADTVLLISCGKLAKSTAKSAWFQKLDRIGAVVQVWPLQRNRILPWLDSRARARGVALDQPALRLLAGRVEGNLLAAAQEIDKLYVLYGSSPLDADTVGAVVADSAHYDVFDLVDSALSGQSARFCRVLNHIRGEGVAPQVVLWAFTRELRTLAKIRFDLDRGDSRSNVFRNHKIWDSRKPLMDAALRRFKLLQIQNFLRRCAAIDRVGKGLDKGDVWEDLLLLGLSLAGNDPFKALENQPGGNREYEIPRNF